MEEDTVEERRPFAIDEKALEIPTAERIQAGLLCLPYTRTCTFHKSATV